MQTDYYITAVLLPDEKQFIVCGNVVCMCMCVCVDVCVHVCMHVCVQVVMKHTSISRQACTHICVMYVC